MNNKIILILLSFAISLLCPFELRSQSIPSETKSNIASYLTEIANREVRVQKVKIDSVSVKNKTVQLFASTNLSYINFSQSQVEAIYSEVKKLLPKEYQKYKIELFTDTQKVEDLVPQNRNKNDLFTNESDKPLITNLSKVFVPSRGLLDKHIAIWQSHGWYYEQKLARWEWQRARIFQTVEDLYTQSYVLPYLVPMLENAGANVLIPRERDIQKIEIIVDNDRSSGKSLYRNRSAKTKWKKGSGKGFANTKDFYLDFENPFALGTYEQVETIVDGKESIAEWIPDVPEKGQYAVYVSYKTVDKSTDDALYTVYHAGGETEFKVNQKMGGGTWIFLGFFTFDKGLNENHKVTLSNRSSNANQIVTADAVKIGGGVGNMARLPNTSGVVTDNVKSSESIVDASHKQLSKIDYQPETSGRPRYTEGARYWLQWAGVPDSVYSRSHGKNDYTDDYQSRGYWVNYLSGGSSVAPKSEGLNIPIDLALAFHSDAGTTLNDSIIGTLGICMTHTNDGEFENGKSRWTSRDLTALVMDEIVNDIRLQYEPNWTRRQIWNRSYSEARVPNVPTMLLELLSHQNFADMRYGLDPRFRFTVSRSVYKGILKFVAQQYETDYVVQPLPVKSFSSEFVGDNQVSLQWVAVDDPTEPTAKADKYIVYTRVEDQDFDNGLIVNDTKVVLNIDKDKIYSFKITALNDGGESFPSEILSVCRKSNEKGIVMVVNGFERISAPFSFATNDSVAGFVDFIDHGVPDKVEYNYIGSQYEFRRQIPWMDDDAAGFGASNGNYETTVIAGNTFDYPYSHGQSIANAGYSFVSSSSKAVSSGQISLAPYKLVDLILGKQKQTVIGRGAFPAEFKTFPKDLQEKIRAYCDRGGNIFVSGAFVASDLWDTELPDRSDQEFASKVLKYKWRVDRAAVEGKIKAVASPFSMIAGNYEFHTKPNPISYAVESPDAIEPFGDASYTVFRYSENNLSAGIASDGSYKTMILGFPFEALKSSEERDRLMRDILLFMYE